MRNAHIAVLLATLACPAIAQAATERPNVILINIDNHNKWDLGYYGNRFIETPNIDRLFKEGVRFEQLRDERGHGEEAHVFALAACGMTERSDDVRLPGAGVAHKQYILMTVQVFAAHQFEIKMPNDVNPAAKVERYRERARAIRFLTLPQIEEQLEVLDRDQVE